MRRRILAGVLAASTAAVFGGVASSPAMAGGGEFTTRVKIVDNAFKPKRVEIGQGTRVVWKNRGLDTHTVTSKKGLWDSGDIAPGERFVRKFKQTGVFRYFCQNHPEMVGKVISGDV